MTMKYLSIDRIMGYDNVQPRSNTAKLVEDKKIPPEVAARIERMEGAHLNGNEAFPLWTAAVLAGNVVGLNNYVLNITSLTYIGMRLLYNTIYINHRTSAVSWIRSSVFFASVSLPISLLIRAARKAADR
ncbi:hypothetical protein BDN72DRAFT_836707 [Pluteus cervinus]|uniref:Uncharacterized protein n=1 Tax=Pluteus cervinus TaxID=181527 RepID=A0ACD3B573_9AGAR|nr:hypothetical protein BDN72DRAFT_836707 [Pluteus cervinus]